ncbi:hypothetical protein LCGC14_0441300 [marine sediment metagenome]|uniref:Uncharacterized protein n=1 Tax=marine sediment metagenome TaxID=412755 RepID=A0A0F9VUI9_9ZZZZ
MPVTLKFEIDKAAQRSINRLNPRAVEDALLEGGRQFRILMLRALVQSTQRLTTTRTGTLARSWRSKQKQPGTIEFTNIAKSSGAQGIPYASFLEFGTRRHRIVPRFKKALRWRLGSGQPVSSFQATTALASNQFAFSKGHFVAGIKKRLIFLKTFRKEGAQLGVFVGRAIERALAKT